MKKILSLLIFICLISTQICAQFFLNGEAIQVSDSCFQLTDTGLGEVGSIWFEEKINLNESFDVLMDLFLGCKDDNGADGIVFGFQPVSTSIGSEGSGIGFGGVQPALAVEFDTWQNFDLSDPSYDHIAIMKDGSVAHGVGSGNLTGPVQANATNTNIEDCEYHQMRVTWNAQTQTLTVFFDCDERLTYTGDVVNEIFDGDPEVFWGFTSATGGASNRHEVCFSYTTFLNGFDDVVICPGGSFQLEVSGGVEYQWTPSNGLSADNIPNPIATPEETITYIVDVIDECGIPFTDTITVFVEGDTVRFDLGADTMICEPNILILDAENGSPATYLWSDGVTNSQREVLSSGNYQVTVTLDDFCVTQASIEVEYQSLPIVNLPEDTILCFGQSLLLDTENTTPVDYLWSTGITTSNILVNEPGTYSVSLTNFCGTDESSITAEYEDCRSLYVPNAFSPNFDGVNDTFTFYSDGNVKEVLRFEVYDRWGGLIFSPLNTGAEAENRFSWDGTLNDKKLENGVYIWILEVIYRDGSTELLKGEITLIR